jgi:uncharacterized membrane protein
VIKFMQFFWGLCTLKTAPQDLPASPALLGVTLLAYLLSGIVVAVLQWSVPKAVLAAMLDTVLFTLLCYVLLWARLLDNRFPQTMTALAGSCALLTLIAAPLVFWQKQVAAPGDSIASFPTLLLLVWTGWNVSVVGHILRHALSTAFALGIGLAAVYTYITLQLMRIIFLY